MTAPGSDPLRPESPVTRVEVPVDTRAPTGTTNAYLVGGLLVDPAARTDGLDEAVTTHRPDRSTASAIEAIAVTHTHPDHTGAVAAYAESTGASVVAHANHVDRFADATGAEPDETVRDGESVGGTDVRVVDTPGHAPDHVAFAVGGRDGENDWNDGGDRDDGDGGGDAEPFRALLCGDLAVESGSVVVGAPDGDLGDYLASLERVRDAGYDRLYPGHGPVIDDPESVCQRLIDHRLERERAVAGAVESGASDVAAVVDAAYEKDLTGVRDLARATVVAHLERLAAEGRIDESWDESTP